MSTVTSLHLGYSAVALSTVLLLAGPAHADTLEVPDDFDTIQDAVDAADPGDTVEVEEGGGSGPNGEWLAHCRRWMVVLLLRLPGVVVV